MKKDKRKFMDLNRETAMRLWNKSFGKETKVKDFTGRLIVKGAYNDRSSEYGWNVDHIFPQSRGGKTADHNLICCHILTNDEKADKFPAFKANGVSYEIIKVENHYEIRPIKKAQKKTEKKEAKQTETNLFDSASGIRLYKEFKSLQTMKRFVGTVEIILDGINGADTALTDFVETLFITEDVQFVGGEHYLSGTSVRILVKNYEMPNNADINAMLDKCVLLNTYFGSYFKPVGAVNDFFVSFRVDAYKDRKEFYSSDGNVNFLNRNQLIQNDSRLKINTLVIQNSYAKEKYKDDVGWNPDLFFDYNYVYPKLVKNLEKEVEGK